jgi:hypothetical protein
MDASHTFTLATAALGFGTAALNLLSQFLPASKKIAV